MKTYKQTHINDVPDIGMNPDVLILKLEKKSF